MPTYGLDTSGLGAFTSLPSARSTQANSINAGPFASLPLPQTSAVSRPASSSSAPYNYGIQDPGNNPVNPGVGEQTQLATQNQWQNPVQDKQVALAGQAASGSPGLDALNNSLGGLSGPTAQGQYWNQVAGQFNTPQAGQTYTQNATAGLDPTGAASAFYNTAMGNYGTNGSYQGGNLSADQYQATQGAFGALPLPDSADPYYDRAVQLGTQAYDQDAASRGVYGSSETLSGVGNMVAGINAARAQNEFQNQMSIDQEQRQREALLGTQAQAADTTGINAFNAGTQATQTYGQLANNANTQQLNQYNDTTGAMNNADITANTHAATGANIAQGVDTTNTANYNAGTTAATNAAGATNAANTTAGNIYNQVAGQNTTGLTDQNASAVAAQGAHDSRVQSEFNDMDTYTQHVMGQVSSAQAAAFAGDEQSFEDWYNAQMAPYIQSGQLSQSQANLGFQASWQLIQQIANNSKSATS
jgi:hypothetical protein